MAEPAIPTQSQKSAFLHAPGLLLLLAIIWASSFTLVAARLAYAGVFLLVILRLLDQSLLRDGASWAVHCRCNPESRRQHDACPARPRHQTQHPGDRLRGGCFRNDSAAFALSHNPWTLEIPAAGGCMIFFRLTAMAGPTFTSMVNLPIPVIGLGFGLVLLDEKFSWSMALALPLIVMGVWLVNQPRRKEPAAECLEP